MHVSDYNLAGAALAAFLVLFFPSTGLIHRRARKMAVRAIAREQARQLEALVLEEATKICAAEEVQQ